MDFEMEDLVFHFESVSLGTPIFQQEIARIEPSKVDVDNEVKFNDAMDIIALDDLYVTKNFLNNGTEKKHFNVIEVLPTINYEELHSLSVTNSVTQDTGVQDKKHVVYSSDIRNAPVQEDLTTTQATSRNVLKTLRKTNPNNLGCRIGKQVKRLRKKQNAQCTLCGKILRCFAHLIVHYRSHTGEKPYVCPVCSTPFRQKAHLVNHISYLHEGGEIVKKNSRRRNQQNMSLQCCFCDLKFDTRRNYSLHIYREHTDRLWLD